jgi:excisionase family DNA binding protein
MQATPTRERELSLAEFCRRITPEGERPVHPSTAYRWALEGRLRVRRYGRRIRVPESGVEEFLASELERWRSKHVVVGTVRTKTQGDRAAVRAAAELGLVIRDDEPRF